MPSISIYKNNNEYKISPFNRFGMVINNTSEDAVFAAKGGRRIRKEQMNRRYKKLELGFADKFDKALIAANNDISKLGMLSILPNNTQPAYAIQNHHYYLNNAQIPNLNTLNGITSNADNNKQDDVKKGNVSSSVYDEYLRTGKPVFRTESEFNKTENTSKPHPWKTVDIKRVDRFRSTTDGFSAYTKEKTILNLLKPIIEKGYLNGIYSINDDNRQTIINWWKDLTTEQKNNVGSAATYLNNHDNVITPEDMNTKNETFKKPTEQETDALFDQFESASRFGDKKEETNLETINEDVDAPHEDEQGHGINGGKINGGFLSAILPLVAETLPGVISGFKELFGHGVGSGIGYGIGSGVGYGSSIPTHGSNVNLKSISSFGNQSNTSEDVNTNPNSNGSGIRYGIGHGVGHGLLGHDGHGIRRMNTISDISGSGIFDSILSGIKGIFKSPYTKEVAKSAFEVLKKPKVQEGIFNAIKDKIKKKKPEPKTEEQELFDLYKSGKLSHDQFVELKSLYNNIPHKPKKIDKRLDSVEVHESEPLINTKTTNLLGKPDELKIAADKVHNGEMTRGEYLEKLTGKPNTIDKLNKPLTKEVKDEEVKEEAKDEEVKGKGIRRGRKKKTLNAAKFEKK